jgi:hypothetical protein
MLYTTRIYEDLFQNSANLNELQVGTCLSIIAAFDLLSQLTLFLITDKLHISSKNCFLIGIVGSASAKFALISSNHYSIFLIVSAFLGYFRNFTNVNYKLIIADYCSKWPEKLPSAFSLSMFINSVTLLTLGQFFGWVRDGNDFFASFCYENILAAFLFLFWVFSTS